jgi:hypothetical protein
MNVAMKAAVVGVGDADLLGGHMPLSSRWSSYCV